MIFLKSLLWEGDDVKVHTYSKYQEAKDRTKSSIALVFQRYYLIKN